MGAPAGFWLKACACMARRVVGAMQAVVSLYLVLAVTVYAVEGSSTPCDKEQYEELRKTPVKEMTDEQYRAYAELREACLGLSPSYSTPYPKDSAASRTLEYARGRTTAGRGAIMLGVGVSALAGGIAIIASTGSASYKVTRINGETIETGTPASPFGAILVIAGTSLSLIGLPVTFVGVGKAQLHRPEPAPPSSRLKMLVGPSSVALSYDIRTKR